MKIQKIRSLPLMPRQAVTFVYSDKSNQKRQRRQNHSARVQVVPQYYLAQNSAELAGAQTCGTVLSALRRDRSASGKCSVRLAVKVTARGCGYTLIMSLLLSSI